MEQPNSEPEQKAKIEATAQAILDARNNHPDCSLADLYDETLMPPDLRKAHQANDKAVSNMDVANAAIAGSNGAVNGSLRAFCKKHFRKRLRSFLDEYIQRSDRKNENKMTQEQINIADMQCWLFRMAQQKWKITPKYCSELFKKYDLLGYISECYDVLHLSSYKCALKDLEEILKSKSINIC